MNKGIQRTSMQRIQNPGPGVCEGCGQKKKINGNTRNGG